MPVPPPDDATAIRRLWERSTAALCAGDWDTYQTLWAHTPEIEIIHPHQPDWRVGWESIGPVYRELLDSGFGCEAVTKSLRIHVSPGGDMAWATAEVQLRTDQAERAEQTLWQTLVFAKKDGHWRLVHGHVSVPRTT